MSFGVDLTNPANQDIKNLDPQIQNEVFEELSSIGDNPEVGGRLQGCPGQIRKYKFKELSVSGEWRAAYIILEEKQFCTIFAVGPRENFYEKVKRRARQVLRHL